MCGGNIDIKVNIDVVHTRNELWGKNRKIYHLIITGDAQAGQIGPKVHCAERNKVCTQDMTLEASRIEVVAQ